MFTLPVQLHMHRATGPSARSTGEQGLLVLASLAHVGNRGEAFEVLQNLKDKVYQTDEIWASRSIKLPLNSCAWVNDPSAFGNLWKPLPASSQESHLAVLHAQHRDSRMLHGTLMSWVLLLPLSPFSLTPCHTFCLPPVMPGPSCSRAHPVSIHWARLLPLEQQ